MLRLGSDPDTWFFYFHIAPGINTNDDENTLTSVYSIINNTEEYPLVLGLNSSNSLETNNPSLIRGSFVLSGSGYNQFSSISDGLFDETKNKIYISINKSLNMQDYDHIANITNKSTQKNTYLASFTTTIDFIDNSDILNTDVLNNQTSCVIDPEHIAYISSINSLLNTINYLNNFSSIYVYNSSSVIHTGKLAVFIDGNYTIRLENYESILNEYEISYYVLDNNKIKTFYQNNSSYNNNLLKNLNTGYIILRIKDSYNNKPNYVKIGSNTTNYSNHFNAAQAILSQFSNNIQQFFTYGDILIYIPSSIDDPSNTTTPEPTQPATIIVQQTQNPANTSSLSVNLIKPNIKCYLTGPQNYTYTIIQNTKFINMIPGVYTIIGDTNDLVANFLNQNNYSLVINQNTTNSIDINFTSYQNQLLIKDI